MVTACVRKSENGGLHLRYEISNLEFRARILFGILGLSAILSIPACKTPTHAEAKVQAEQRWSQVRGQVKLQLARQQFERGLFEDAIKTLQEASTLDPTSVESIALLSKANLELGKISTAEQALASAALRGLVSAELHYLQGVVFEQRNEFAAALVQFEKARQLDPTNVMYVLAQVETLVALDRRSEALVLVDSNANQFDDEASLAVLGARVAALMGDPSGALQRLRNSTVLSAGSRTATEELGTLLAAQGHCPEAIRVLEPLCNQPDADTGDVSYAVRRSLAQCYLEQDSPQLAQHLLTESSLGSRNQASGLLLAQAALASGEYLTALQALENARDGKDSPEIRLLLATVHWKRGDLEKAQSVLDEVLSASPADTDAWCLLGEVRLAMGHLPEAREAFERAIFVDPECGWAAAQLSGMRVPVKPEITESKKILKRS